MKDRHVAIVGAGIVGVCLAYELSRAGIRVTVLDRGEPASGTTKDSFAWIANQTAYRNGEDLTLDQRRTYFNLHRLASGAWRRLESTIDEDLGLRWGGSVHWQPPDSPDCALLEAELERRQRWGGLARRIDSPAIRYLVPGSRPGPVGTAFYAEDEAIVDPMTATRGVVSAATALEAELNFSSQVEGFAIEGERVVGVETSDNTTFCDEVVIAAGVGTPALAEQVGVSVPLERSAGALIHLEALPLFVEEPGFLPVVFAPGIHLLQRPDGRMVVARHFSGESVEAVPAEADVETLMADAVRFLPPLKDSRIERVSVGERIVPIDGLPILGRSDQYPNVRVLVTNAGISLGPLLGQLVAQEIANERDVELLDPYRQTRFDTQSS